MHIDEYLIVQVKWTYKVVINMLPYQILVSSINGKI